MHNQLHLLTTACAGILALSVSGGCTRQPGKAAPPQVPVVPVSKPIDRLVTDYAEYPGRTEAVQLLDVRARVTGYLVKMPFREGDEVRGPDHPAAVPAGTLGLLAASSPGPLPAVTSLHPLRTVGDLLFEIDPQPYQALYNRAVAELGHTQARLRLAQADNARAKVVAKTPGAMSQQDLDKYQAAEDEAAAAVTASTANIAVHKVNLDFCRVTSPISGQVSRYLVTLGNVAKQDDTVLTTVVSLDPIYAYFNMDEPTLERLKSLVNDGKISADLQTAQLPVYLGLQTTEDFSHAGTIDFLNNQVNPSTGTISVRGVFPNPKPAGGVRLLTPGMFVRMRLPLGPPRQALLVPDRAVGMDQGLRFLYVLDTDNRVQYRRVRTGPLQDDGLRVIEEGLKPDDRVVVSMIQQLRPHQLVEPETVISP
jgi:multidrug efflux system membrane fusion protein